MKLTIVAGARPNFMKIAPLIEALTLKKDSNLQYRLVHTGQHFDIKMSGNFFEQLGIPPPDINLNAGGGSQTEQTANIMIRFEKELLENPTDLVIVVGDVTSTMACSIVAKKLNIKVAHIEAGIRSGDMAMPEEVNRMVTDAITDYFFTTSEHANVNLRKSGVPDSRIFFVGNTMIDTLLKQMSAFKKPDIWDNANLKDGEYFVLTLHRPSNVDNSRSLLQLIENIVFLSRDLPVIFPVHPRTALVLQSCGCNFGNLYLVEPMGYLEFNYLVKYSKAVITDSGGITEEATVMNIPCLSLRNTTERPETCLIGTNQLLGNDPEALVAAFEILFRGDWKKGAIPELWDGNTSERIVHQLIRLFASRECLCFQGPISAVGGIG